MELKSVGEKLAQLFSDECRNWSFPAETSNLPEPQFTGDLLFPRAEAFVRSLNRKSIAVRADGATAPRSIALGGMNFVPDLEIFEYEQRYLAVEVKFLRDVDPSGSFAKAIGQAAVYRALGFEFAHVVVMDCRSQSYRRWGKLDTGLMKFPEGIGTSLFVTSPAGIFTCIDDR